MIGENDIHFVTWCFSALLMLCIVGTIIEYTVETLHKKEGG
jgi:hypothetical protein